MTLDLPPAPNGPLSLQGEGWGEGTASTPNTAATGKRCSRASSLLRRAVPVLALGLPARRAHNRGRGNGGSRWECQDDSEFTACSERPPLPLGEGWGEGTASTQTPQPPGNAVREQARSYEEPCQFLLWDCQPVGRITADAGMAEVDGSVRMTPNLPLAPNGPLSLQGEGWGEGTVSTQTPQPPGNAVREQARSYEEPCHILLWDCQPVGRITADRGMAGIDGSFRMTPDLPPAPNGPLSLWERAGVRGRSQPQTPQPPGNAVREQARSYTKAHSKVPWGAASITSTRLRPLALARYRAWSAVL